jgi:hypothetical protein
VAVYPAESRDAGLDPADSRSGGLFRAPTGNDLDHHAHAAEASPAGRGSPQAEQGVVSRPFRTPAAETVPVLRASTDRIRPVFGAGTGRGPTRRRLTLAPWYHLTLAPWYHRMSSGSRKSADWPFPGTVKLPALHSDEECRPTVTGEAKHGSDRVLRVAYPYLGVAATDLDTAFLAAGRALPPGGGSTARFYLEHHALLLLPGLYTLRCQRQRHPGSPMRHRQWLPGSTRTLGVVNDAHLPPQEDSRGDQVRPGAQNTPRGSTGDVGSWPRSTHFRIPRSDC